MDMLKGTLTNALPMIAIGGWINWTFFGFLASELKMHCCRKYHCSLTSQGTISSHLSFQGYASVWS